MGFVILALQRLTKEHIKKESRGIAFLSRDSRGVSPVGGPRPTKRAGAPLREIDPALAPVAAVVVQRDPDIGQERVLTTRLGWTRLSVEDVGPN